MQLCPGYVACGSTFAKERLNPQGLSKMLYLAFASLKNPNVCISLKKKKFHEAFGARQKMLAFQKP